MIEAPQNRELDQFGNLELLHGREFLDDLQTTIQRTLSNTDSLLPFQKRFYVQAMETEYSPTTVFLFEGIQRANQLGFDTRVHFDGYPAQVNFNGELLLPTLDLKKATEQNKGIRENFEQFRQLHSEGTKIHVTHSLKTLKDKIFFLKGVDHRKMIIIGSTAYVMGFNFYDSSFDLGDYAIKITNPEIVETLAQKFKNTETNKRLQNSAESFGRIDLITDSGTEDSLVIDYLATDIENAENRVYALSEIPLDPFILEAMAKAHKSGANVRILETHPKHQNIDVRFWYFKESLRYGYFPQIPRIYLDFYNHGKLFVVDNAVYVGSHNGSRTKAAELMVRIENPKILQQAIASLEHTVNHKRYRRTNIFVSEEFDNAA